MDIFDLYPSRIHTEPNTGCWLWIGGTNGVGYGKLQLNNKSMFAHRLSYAISIGDIPEGMMVCHRCDQPSCVNPDHLFTGTGRDNFEDMRFKNRHNFSGLNKGNPKLTIEQVSEIRSLKDVMTLQGIADRYGVTSPTIHYILKNKTWVGQRKN